MRFFKRKPEAKPVDNAPQDFRKSGRRDVWGELDLYEAVIDGRRARVRNLSDGGMALAIEEVTAPGRGVLELYRNGALVKRGFGIRCWGRDATVGYKLISDLAVISGSPEGVDEVALKARGIRRRLAAELERMRPSASKPEPADGAMGGLRGDALRARLGMPVGRS